MEAAVERRRPEGLSRRLLVPVVGVLVALATLVPTPLSGQAPSVRSSDMRASVRGATTREADDGRVVFPLLLRSTALRTLEARVRVETPPGWDAPGPSGPLEMESGATRVHLLGLGVPASARAGEHRVEWSVEVRDEPVAAGAVVVRVPPVPGLALEAADRPDFVVAGTSRVLRFRMTNRGNTPLRVRLHTRWTGGEAPAIEPEAAELEPGRSVPLRVRLEPGSGTGGPAPGRQVLEVLARAAGSGLETKHASVPLEVVAAAGGAREAPRHSLPVEASLRAAPGGGGGVWGELSGSGPLRAGGTTRLGFLFRGPEPRGVEVAGRDRYRVALEGTGFRLTAGDQVMRRSELTEPGRRMFGGSGELALGPLVAGGFHGRDRRPGRERATSGGFAGLEAGRTASLVLSRVERTGPSPADLWSVSARLRPARILDVRAEAGREASVPEPATARRVAVSGAWSGGRYSLRHLRGDSLYPEPYRGRSEDHAGLTLRPAGELRLGGAVSRDVGGPGRAWLPTDDRAERLRATAGAGWGRAFDLELRRTRERVRAGGPEWPVGTWSGRIRLGASAGPVTVSPVAEYGRIRAEGLDGPAPVLNARLEISAGAGSDGRLSGSVGYESGDPLSGRSSRERWQGRLHGSLRIGRRVRLRIVTRATRVLGQRPWTRGMVDVEASAELPRGHRLEARARTSRSFGRPLPARSSVSVGYRIPLGVPLGRAGTGGRVAGRVVGPGPGGGADSVLVRMGSSAALTDEDGRFVFPAVEPGRHRIRLDAGTLSPGSVVLGSDARDVEVRGADDHEVEFRLGRGGTIEGTVRRFEVDASLEMIGDDEGSGDPEARLRPAGPVTRALVVLEGPNGTRRRLTGPEGGFAVGGLDPGTWRVHVRSRGLPVRHRVRPDPATVELEPGGRRSVGLRVVPVRRKVRMMSEETVEVDGGAGRWYDVRPDDPSLMEIARRVYDDGFLWPKIWAANRERLPDPDRIEPGQRLRIPGKAPLTEAEKRLRSRYLEDGGGPSNRRNR